MVDTSSGRRAKPFNVLWDEWEATKQPVQERANILPFATYADGSTHLAFPGLLAMPFEGFALGQALSGHDIAANPEIGIPAAVDVAGGAMTGGFAATAAGAAPKNAVGIFGGRLAKTADHAALAKADQMASQGVPREQIWNDTGWFQGVDGKWRFEIDDSGAKIPFPTQERVINQGYDSGSSLRGALFHDDLYKAYPDISRTKWDLGRTEHLKSGSYEPDNSGAWNMNFMSATAPTTSDMTSILLHEAQHAIQGSEDFLRGATANTFTQQSDAELARNAMTWRRELERHQGDLSYRDNLVAEEYAKLGAQDWVPPPNVRDVAMDYGGNPTPQLQEIINLYGLDKRTSPLSPKEMYRRTAGETEARTVQKRQNLTADERRARPPWLDYDVPESDQITRFYSNSNPSTSLALELAKDAANVPAQKGFNPSRPFQDIDQQIIGLHKDSRGLLRGDDLDAIQKRGIESKSLDDVIESRKTDMERALEVYNGRFSGHSYTADEINDLLQSIYDDTAEANTLFTAHSTELPGDTLGKLREFQSTNESRSMFDNLAGYDGLISAELDGLRAATPIPPSDSSALAQFFNSIDQGQSNAQSLRNLSGVLDDYTSTLGEGYDRIGSQAERRLNVAESIRQRMRDYLSDNDVEALFSNSNPSTSLALELAKDAAGAGERGALMANGFSRSAGAGTEAAAGRLAGSLEPTDTLAARMAEGQQGHMLDPSQGPPAQAPRSLIESDQWSNARVVLPNRYQGRTLAEALSDAKITRVADAFDVDSNGHPIIPINGRGSDEWLSRHSIYENADGAKDPAYGWHIVGGRAVSNRLADPIDLVAELNSLIEPQYDYYFRGTNNLKEVDLAKKGVLRNSKNYVDNTREAGLSVSPNPGYVAMVYDNGYKLRGRKVGTGSDGEPLLDPSSIEVISDMLPSHEIAQQDIDARKLIQRDHGLDFNTVGVPISGERFVRVGPGWRDLYANSNPSTSLALELAKDAANVPAQKGFTAYHGSPHDFDKFDMSKIGTGGGAQDYGHGLYFAENEGIAKQYRDKLSKQQAAIKPAFADTALDMSNGDHAQALAYARRRADTEEDGIRKMRWNAAAEYLDAGRPELDGTGRMYEVRINADPNDFLDWDKPISQQSEKVRGAIEAMGDKALLAKSGTRYNQFDPFTEIKGGDFINSLNRHAGSPYAARMAFDEQGIPGVKYLDENSRTAGDGSHNYVLFRDDIIDIVKKYGVAYAAMMYGEEAVNSAMGTGAAASPGQTDY